MEALLAPVCRWGVGSRSGGLQLSAMASSGHRAENETGQHGETPQHPGQGAATEPEGQQQAGGPSPGATAVRGGG